MRQECFEVDPILHGVALAFESDSRALSAERRYEQIGNSFGALRAQFGIPWDMFCAAFADKPCEK